MILCPHFLTSDFHLCEDAFFCPPLMGVISVVKNRFLSVNDDIKI